MITIVNELFYSLTCITRYICTGKGDPKLLDIFAYVNIYIDDKDLNGAFLKFIAK